MKLLKHQSASLVEIIKSKGFVDEDYVFVKRKGRIRVELVEYDGIFEFFRRKSVKIDEQTHAWEEQEKYELNDGQKRWEVPNWDEVLGAFTNWLNRFD